MALVHDIIPESLDGSQLAAMLVSVINQSLDKLITTPTFRTLRDVDDVRQTVLTQLVEANLVVKFLNHPSPKTLPSFQNYVSASVFKRLLNEHRRQQRREKPFVPTDPDWFGTWVSTDPDWFGTWTAETFEEKTEQVELVRLVNESFPTLIFRLLTGRVSDTVWNGLMTSRDLPKAEADRLRKFYERYVRDRSRMWKRNRNYAPQPTCSVYIQNEGANHMSNAKNGRLVLAAIPNTQGESSAKAPQSVQDLEKKIRTLEAQLRTVVATENPIPVIEPEATPEVPVNGQHTIAAPSQVGQDAPSDVGEVKVKVVRKEVKRVKAFVADLVVDELYQRPCNVHRADRIAKKWDDRKFNPPLVNLRDGKLYIVDGQHTIAALKIRGELWVEVDQLEVSISREQEAELFREINNSRVAVKAFNNFTASCVAGNPAANAISTILKELGLELVSGGRKGNQARRNPTLGCTTALEKSYHNVGGRLKDALSVIGTVFGFVHDSFRGPIVLAVSRLFRAFPDIDAGNLAAKMKDHWQRPRDLELAASSMKTISAQSQQDLLIARQILGAYNYGLRQNRLDEAVLVRKGSNWIHSAP